MTVSIYYKLSKEGQRDAVRKGVEPTQIQKIDVPDELCLDLIDQMSISPDGQKAIFLHMIYNEVPAPWKNNCTNVTWMAARPKWGVLWDRIQKPEYVPSAPDARYLPKVKKISPHSKPIIVGDDSYPGIILEPASNHPAEDVAHEQDSILIKIREIAAHNKALQEKVNKANAEYKVIWDQAREKAKAEYEKSMAEYEDLRARLEKYQEEKKRKAHLEVVEWIETHGSPRLKKALEANMIDRCRGVYNSERVKHDLGNDWLLDYEMQERLYPDWEDDLKDVINPSEELLDAILKAEKIESLTNLETFYLPENYDYDQGAVYVILAEHKPTGCRVGMII